MRFWTLKTLVLGATMAGIGTAHAAELTTGTYACLYRHLVGIQHNERGQASSGRINPAPDEDRFIVTLSKVTGRGERAVACIQMGRLGPACENSEETIYAVKFPTRQIGLNQALYASAFSPDIVPNFYGRNKQWFNFMSRNGPLIYVLLETVPVTATEADGSERHHVNHYLEQGDCVKME